LAFLIKLIDLLLYSNLWIALGALAMVWQMQFISGITEWNSPLALLIFFSTIVIYAMHRIIGFTIIDRTIENRRLHVIRRFQSHIIIYAIFALAGAAFFIFRVERAILLLLIPPAIISTLYVSPLFRNRRLRDISYLKIFLIASVWIWITVCVPLMYFGNYDAVQLGVVSTEKLFFMLAITLPFDIRDLKVDQLQNVKTLPMKLGVSKTRKLIKVSLILAIVSVAFSFALGVYSASQTVGLSLFYMLLGYLIHTAIKKEHDYFYSGMLDGTFLLQLVFVLVFT